MVSFTLDAVKFLLIYRYLQNIYRFKRGSLYLSLVPRNQAFALPFPEDKQHLETHADMRA